MFLNTDTLRTDEIFLKLERTTEANPEKRWVPAYYFKICSTVDETEIGCCDFRVGNTEKLYFGGNIGYEIYEAHRGHHYAGKACLLLLQLARNHDLKYIHISCYPQNLASRKTCEYAGGIFNAIIDLPTDNDLYLEGERKICVYRFDIRGQNDAEMLHSKSRFANSEGD